MNKTKIEWVKNLDGTQGYSINPVKGLCPMACPYCYAAGERGLYKRFQWNPEVRFDIKPLLAIENINKPSRVFVGSTMELFGDWIPKGWLEEILEVTSHFPQHTFIFLTKQPQNLVKFSPFPPNCWVGVTATDTKMFHNACYHLADVKASVKYLSIEPFLEWQDDGYQQRRLEEVGIKQVIIGAQTKPYRPPKIEWVREIVEACDKVGVPVFLKNNLKPLIESSGFLNAGWAAKEWVQCKYPILRQEMPCK